MRFNMLRDTSDENRVVTFGFFAGTRDELERSQEGHGYDDRRGRGAEVRRGGRCQWRVFDVVLDMHSD
jgi:hypothetical protein